MQIVVTVMMVLGFGLTVWGAVRIYADTQRRHRRMNSERAVRLRLLDEMRVARHAAAGDDESLAALNEAWRQGHVDAGIEPFTWQSANEGREFLAEAIIREGASDSRRDLLIVAVGLVLGLVASLLDVWLL